MATAISWTDETWNPTTGCSRVSEGCRYCYAERMSLERSWSKLPWTAANAEDNVREHPDRLTKPYSWKRPVRVFVNSMSDLFHPRVSDDFRRRVWEVMLTTPQHTYQILTKRPELAAKWPGPWAPNIWMGTSVELARHLDRVDELRMCPATIRFLSCEPLLGPLTGIDLSGIAWVIVGGESGPHMTDPTHPRWMRQEWARELRDACARAGVAYYYKQDSGHRTEMRPYLIEQDGSRSVIQEYPNQVRVML